MTRGELIDVLANRADITRFKAEVVVVEIFNSMIQALKNGERIEIRGFGSFQLRTYDAYTGRNPRTHELISVKEKTMPFFKVGKDLKLLLEKIP